MWPGVHSSLVWCVTYFYRFLDMHKSLNANFLATFHCPLVHSPFATVHQTVWPNMLFQGGFEAAKPVVGEVIRAAHTYCPHPHRIGQTKQFRTKLPQNGELRIIYCKLDTCTIMFKNGKSSSNMCEIYIYKYLEQVMVIKKTIQERFSSLS